MSLLKLNQEIWLTWWIIWAPWNRPWWFGLTQHIFVRSQQRWAAVRSLQFTSHKLFPLYNLITCTPVLSRVFSENDSCCTKVRSCGWPYTIPMLVLKQTTKETAPCPKPSEILSWSLYLSVFNKAQILIHHLCEPWIHSWCGNWSNGVSNCNERKE